MNRFIENYAGKTYDLLIIGGGITGASIAYEAALRGLKVALVEKNDFASATSSATSKMIHGGLRYLSTGEIHLVRESLRERRILQNIAPNFVHPLPFIFAVYDYMTTPMWMIKMGLTLYELLSLDKSMIWDKSKKIPHFRSLAPKTISEKISFANKKGLKGGFLYYDCWNHSPERLTLAFIKSAVHYGADVANYAQMTEFIYKKDNKTIKITGAKIYDRLNNKTLNLKARLIVNASGPWADILLSKIKQNQQIKLIRRSEGIHLVIRGKLTDNYVFASQSLQGEHFFVIPFRGHTIIGTTDKEFKGDPDQYTITKDSIDELLEKVNTSFGNGHKISYNDILFVYGGLRPLVEDQTKDVYTSSRKYEITDEKIHGIEGLITVEGGKFTTSRRLAQRLVDKAIKKLNIKFTKSNSDNKYLIHSNIPDLERFITIKTMQYPMLQPNQIRFLVYSYGTEIDQIMDLFLSHKKLQNILNKDGENLAQVVFAIRNEMAYNLEDILLRRTGIAWLGYPQEQKLNLIIQTAASELGWDDKEIKAQLESFKQKFALINSLKNNYYETKNISA